MILLMCLVNGVIEIELMKEKFANVTLGQFLNSSEQVVSSGGFVV